MVLGIKVALLASTVSFTFGLRVEKNSQFPMLMPQVSQYQYQYQPGLHTYHTSRFWHLFSKDILLCRLFFSFFLLLNKSLLPFIFMKWTVTVDPTPFFKVGTHKSIWTFKRSLGPVLSPRLPSHRLLPLDAPLPTPHQKGWDSMEGWLLVFVLRPNLKRQRPTFAQWSALMKTQLTI